MVPSSAIPTQGIVAVLAALMLAGLVTFVVRRRRATAASAMFEDPDYELLFPEGPNEGSTARRTAVGRKITRG